jgi:hypothetical protein
VPGQTPGDDPWERHRAKVAGRGGVDPEGEGGPDEGWNESLKEVRFNQAASPAGSAASPPVDGDGNPDNPRPPRPEVSEPFSHSQAFSGAASTASSSVATSPTPDPDDPTPPRPETSAGQDEPHQ